MWVGLIQSVEGLDRTTPEQEEILLVDSLQTRTAAPALFLASNLLAYPANSELAGRHNLVRQCLKISLSLSLSMYTYVHIHSISYISLSAPD